MSGEVRGGMEPARIECLDGDGSEIIPAGTIALALECPRLLKPELGSVDSPVRPFAERLRGGTRAIEIIYKAAYYGRVQNADNEGVQQWVDTMVAATDDLRQHGGEGLGDLTQAMFRLSPEEFAFLSRMLEETRGNLIEEDFVAAGELSPTLDSRNSRVRRTFDGLPGQHSRLRENTRKNLQELVHVQEAYTSLTFIQGHELLVAAIGQGVIDRMTPQHRQQSYDLLEELKAIANDEAGTPIDQLGAQIALWRKVRRFANGVGSTDPEIGIRTYGVPYPEAVDYLWESARELGHSANTLNMAIYGRAFRLNGNTHLPNDATVAEFFGFPSLRREPTADHGQNEVSGHEQYTDRVRNYLAHISIEQPGTLSAKEVKQRQLDGARAALVRGEHDSGGTEVVKGRSKREALEYVSDVEFLLDFINRTSSLSAAKQQLEQAISDAHQTTRLIDALINDPGGERNVRLLESLGVEVPEVKSIEDLAETVKEDWTTAEYLIRNYWSEGPQKAAQLRQLLFLSSEEIEKLEARL